MAVLVIAACAAGVLNRDATARAVAAVAGLGPVTVLCAGAQLQAAAAQAACIAGVTQVSVVDTPDLAHGLAEPLAACVVSLAGEFSHIVAASTAESRSFMPRIAAMLDVMVIPEVSAVLDAETFERPVYAGNAIQKLRTRDRVKVLTVRTASFEAAGEGAPAPVVPLAVAAVAPVSAWVSQEVAVNTRPELTSAKRVVSGGRGVASKDNFGLIEGLADKLSAAVGASRAAVDSGYAPNDWQVGQTGKVVAPELYVAVGISGAIQHLAGMKDSKIIVAINKDEDAPIFQVADFSLVGDLFTVVPELTAKL